MLVAPENLDAVPIHLRPQGRLGQELVEPFRRGAAGQRDRKAPAAIALAARRMNSSAAARLTASASGKMRTMGALMNAAPLERMKDEG